MIHRQLDRISRRLSIASLIFLVLVTVMSAIFVHEVSPLRDPAFQPNSANAGSPVWWVKGVGEQAWIRAAVILAGVLAINSMLVLWTQRIVRQIGLLMMLGFGMWFLLYLVFLLYLLGQWLVD
jgi:hypothetical protein